MELSNLIYKEDLNNGATGPTGPIGPSSDSTSCFCVDQMRNIIQQIIILYQNDNLIIAMESGNNVSGRAGSLLPAPTPVPTDCGADCEAAIRSYLPVGTTGVDINAGGQTVAQGTVLKSEFGMVVIVGNNNSDPTFVSLCKAEVVNK